MNPLPMVWADLKSMRGVAFVSIALIALAVAVGVAIGAQERALRIATARAADDFPILIGAAGSVTQLVLTSVYLQPEALPLMDGAILDQIAGDPRVAEAAPIAFGDVVLGYPVVGTTADFVTRWGRLIPNPPAPDSRAGSHRCDDVIQDGEQRFVRHGISDSPSSRF